MKRVKILAVILALAALCIGILSGCDNEKDGSEIGEGPIYTLQEAYDGGYLTKEEIMSEDYTPIPKVPQELSEAVSYKIRETVASELRCSNIKNAKADGVNIIHYYGTYDGAVAVIVTHSYLGDSPAVVVDSSYSVAGVIIHYWTYNHIQIWIEK